ncbi:MAG TPA: hypothetical protein VGN57_21600 [Pirellulaceae bacterium]|jgi:hypothetical protein|nr:hypothetical protein [Pirellulaceae bacterium]
MSRRFFVRAPQFGLLTLFAMMLLFVSGAGWFRFQYDLYQEEEEILADLVEAGCQIVVHRHDLVSFEGEPFYWHWLGVPYFGRVRVLAAYQGTPSHDLIERAARLPFLESFDCRSGGSRPQRYPDSAPILAPSPPQAATPNVEAPLPRGEVLNRDATDELLRTWKAAWASPSEVPYGTLRIRDPYGYGPLPSASTTPEYSAGDKFIAYGPGGSMRYMSGTLDPDGYGPLPFASTTPEYFAEDIFIAYGPGGSMRYMSGTLDLKTLERVSSLDLESGRFIERMRESGEFARYHIDGRAADFRQHATGRASLEFALQELQAMERKAEFVDPTTNLHLAKAYRLDDARCRIDFVPIVILREDGTTEDEISLNAVFMEADDYPLEAFDLAVSRSDSTGVVPPSEMQFRWRGTLSRHADQYLVDSAASDMPMANRGSPSLPLQHRTELISIAYDLTPPPDSAFDPAAWNAVEFLDPRPLPIWRWYRVTFAIGVVLLGFILMRNVVSRFRRKWEALPSSERMGDSALD